MMFINANDSNTISFNDFKPDPYCIIFQGQSDEQNITFKFYKNGDFKIDASADIMSDKMAYTIFKNLELYMPIEFKKAWLDKSSEEFQKILERNIKDAFVSGIIRGAFVGGGLLFLLSNFI